MIDVRSKYVTNKSLVAVDDIRKVALLNVGQMNKMSREDAKACIASYFPWYPPPSNFVSRRSTEQLKIDNPNSVLNVVFSNGTPYNVSINELGQQYGYPVMQQNVTAAARIVYMHPSGSIITHPNKGIMSGPVHPFTQIATALSYVYYINVRLFAAGMPLLYVVEFEKSVNQVVTASIAVDNLKERLRSIIYDDRQTAVSVRDSFPATFVSFVVPPLNIKVTIRIFDKGSVCINGVPDLDLAYFIVTSFLYTLDAYLVACMPLPKGRTSQINFPLPALLSTPVQTPQLLSGQEKTSGAKVTGSAGVKKTRKKRAVAVDVNPLAMPEKHSILNVFRLGGQVDEEDPDMLAALLIEQMDGPQDKGFFDS